MIRSSTQWILEARCLSVSELGSAVADDEIAIDSVADRCLLSGGKTDIPSEGVRTVFDPKRA
jgi:hypothetical protein